MQSLGNGCGLLLLLTFNVMQQQYQIEHCHAAAVSMSCSNSLVMQQYQYHVVITYFQIALVRHFCLHDEIEHCCCRAANMEHMDGGLGDEHGRRCRRCGHSVRTKWITLIAFLSQHWRFPTLNHEYFNAAVVGTFATAVGTFYAYQQANEAFQASDEYKVQEAVKKFMSPHQVSEAENIVKREVMEAIKDRVRVWKKKDHATIISGRYMAGKTVAVEEALRGTRGVFRFCIKVADWESLMYQKLGVKDADMFEQVLRRVRQELAKHPDNLTKFPIMLLDIPRETPTGRSLVSFKTINLKSISFKVSSREAP